MTEFMNNTNNDTHNGQDSLASRIIEAREGADLTQEAFANLIGVKQSTLDRWEQGITTPRANQVSMIASHLNVPIVWLLAGGENNSSTDPSDRQRLINEKINLARRRIKDLENLLNEISAINNP